MSACGGRRNSKPVTATNPARWISDYSILQLRAGVRQLTRFALAHEPQHVIGGNVVGPDLVRRFLLALIRSRYGAGKYPRRGIQGTAKAKANFTASMQ